MSVRTDRPRLSVIVYLRATAILLIVAGHSYSLADIGVGTVFNGALSNLVKGATAIFVFISGFVFDYVYSARFDYRTFLLDRAKKLLIPYCVLTILAGLMFSDWIGGGLSTSQLFRFFVLGETFMAYWYIPFILVMFALAPLHRRFMDQGIAYQAAIIIVGAILTGLVQRPIGNTNALQSIVFYMPIYLAGLFVSLHRETLLPALQKIWPGLLVTAVLMATIQSVGGQNDNMHKPFFALHGFELMGPQKLAFSLALVGFFAACLPPPGRVVRIIADTSFAIFFLHPFVLRLIEGTAHFKLTHLPWLDLAIAVTAIVTICVFVALALRALFNANSRYLTGY